MLENVIGDDKDIIIQITENVEELNIKVVELIWTDYESLVGISGFIKCFYPQHNFLICCIPEFINIHLIFLEPIYIVALRFPLK